MKRILAPEARYNLDRCHPDVLRAIMYMPTDPKTAERIAKEYGREFHSKKKEEDRAAKLLDLIAALRKVYNLLIF